ncbi:BppU family phage baseplate upper protein [Staphylococcus saprophyticus]|uniref:BppU family phage baseplate upper protein n=1 Tax=Staphylococcus saprophyticus TaxID=29385 RepID=UPI002DB9FF09|nr:BppU family phage baseplate upper protein [Staphylococcus saprophyticus]MEB6799968.1 phage baseplate upper protein [Staphylococcus saprophyticus]
MSMNKVVKTNLDVNAYYQDIKKMNIEFYNQDIGTAKFEFQITRNDKPMPLSEVNVDSYIAIVTSNGEKKVDNLTFENEMNGIVSYTLPDDVLHHVGKTLGEVYITQKGTGDTVVVRSFEFNIKDAVINTISSDTKLSYIRKFDDLLEIVNFRVAAMEEALANLEDYISKVKQTSNDAIAKIGVKENQVLLAIESEKNEIIELITNDSLLKISDFETYKTNIDNQMVSFNDTVEEKTKNKVNNDDFENKLNQLKNELITYTDSKKDAVVVPLSLINGAEMTSAGVDSETNVTLTYFSIGNGYFYCQLNGWLRTPALGDFTSLPANLKIATTWNRGWDVPHRTTLDNYQARIYINYTGKISTIKLSSTTIPFSLDSISFIAKEVK